MSKYKNSSLMNWFKDNPLPYYIVLIKYVLVSMKFNKKYTIVIVVILLLFCLFSWRYIKSDDDKDDIDYTKTKGYNKFLKRKNDDNESEDQSMIYEFGAKYYEDDIENNTEHPANNEDDDNMSDAMSINSYLSRETNNIKQIRMDVHIFAPNVPKIKGIYKLTQELKSMGIKFPVRIRPIRDIVQPYTVSEILPNITNIDQLYKQCSIIGYTVAHQNKEHMPIHELWDKGIAIQEIPEQDEYNVTYQDGKLLFIEILGKDGLEKSKIDKKNLSLENKKYLKERMIEQQKKLLKQQKKLLKQSKNNLQEVRGILQFGFFCSDIKDDFTKDDNFKWVGVKIDTLEKYTPNIVRQSYSNCISYPILDI